MQRCLLLLLSITLCCCVAPEVAGPYSARLSGSDIQQITALAAERKDIKQRVFSIWADRSDRAEVRSGSHSIYSQFTVVKERGQWRIASPIMQAEIFPTG